MPSHSYTTLSFRCFLATMMVVGALSSTSFGVEAGKAPDYASKIAPIFKKYCVSCHNRNDFEGKLSLESFADLQKGGEHGPILFPNQGETSRMIRLLDGSAEPRMPPEGSEAPSASEIAVLKAWVDTGAKGPDGVEPNRNVLLVPKIAPAKTAPALTALAFSPDGKLLASGLFGKVEIRDAETNQVVTRLESLVGKVNAVHFSNDGTLLIAASGISGLYGQAVVWQTGSWQKVQGFVGHRDAMFDAELSPDGKTIVTCSYDRQIKMWNTANGELIRTIEGHNDAVYDVVFSPDATLIASASGDKTVKIWKAATGERLDTLSQPQGEQYSVLFSPDGKFVVAGGADNRIRIWRLVSTDKPQINPLLEARFAHEGPVLKLAFADGGSKLVSAGQDRSLKLWESRKYTEIKLYPSLRSDLVSLAVRPNAPTFVAGLADGSIASFACSEPAPSAVPQADSSAVVSATIVPAAEVKSFTESEPNDVATAPNPVTVPVKIQGVIDATAPGATHDVDCFRFQSRKGQTWMVEVNAARNKSPLDSNIDVLSSDGKPIERLLMQAVRDSYFTFRGKDSDTSDDFRIQNWQEMELNDYLYADGEVVKLWLYPRGPDSGFKVYPGAGKRWTYFDTTPVAHPVFGPCYIVQPLAPGSSPIPNGLPVFPIYYENDDDSWRQWGTDSRLQFKAPADGEFVVRIGDSRGLEGEAYKYDLTIREANADFRVALGGANPEINAGSGKEFSVTVDRLDGFDGDVSVQVEGLPPGFHVTSPLIIQAGQTTALGCLTADLEAPPPTPENAKASKVTASATINGKLVTHEVGSLGEIKLAAKPKIRISIHPSSEHAQAVVSDPNLPPTPEHPLELVIQPGQTISAVVRAERNGFDGRIPLGNADSGRNLPHGVYVDNIGLNGLLIVEGQNERQFFITAAKWVPNTTRTFHLRAEIEGNQTSWPIIVHVRDK